jgi:hypothetical protein
MVVSFGTAIVGTESLAFVGACGASDQSCQKIRRATSATMRRMADLLGQAEDFRGDAHER